jgi:6-pyruvoyltetrahydropterin/6-carboxytetrahydropterin synthase
MSAPQIRPWYRSVVRVGFPALHSIRGLENGNAIGRPHGHDFTAEFRFETAHLIYPGVVIDDDTRHEIERHVRDRLAYRDLDRLLGQPSTCEAIAEHLANWFLRSARPPGDARLVSVAVSTGSGAHAEVALAEER